MRGVAGRGLALLLLLGLALAQNPIQMRLGLGGGVFFFGLGMEAELRRNLTGGVYADLDPANPGLALGGRLLFKPDLGQYDPALSGLRPYLGGGLGGVLGPAASLGLVLAAGLEGRLDPSTGLFLEGEYLYGLKDAPKRGRIVLGASFR